MSALASDWLKIVTQDGSVSYEAINRYLDFCRHCSVCDFIEAIPLETIHTNGLIEVLSVAFIARGSVD